MLVDGGEVCVVAVQCSADTGRISRRVKNAVLVVVDGEATEVVSNAVLAAANNQEGTAKKQRRGGRGVWVRTGRGASRASDPGAALSSHVDRRIGQIGIVSADTAYIPPRMMG
jgi:hypothetical protein